MKMKKIIHTIGFEEDVMIQQLEGKTVTPEIPPDATVRIIRGRA